MSVRFLLSARFCRQGNKWISVLTTFLLRGLLVHSHHPYPHNQLFSCGPTSCKLAALLSAHALRPSLFGTERVELALEPFIMIIIITVMRRYAHLFQLVLARAPMQRDWGPAPPACRPPYGGRINTEEGKGEVFHNARTNQYNKLQERGGYCAHGLNQMGMCSTTG
jgi:hypothetical protein